MPKHQSSVIKVIGVGGGGSNAVNHMISEGIRGVDFILCNTDAQALEMGEASTKIQLGVSLTEGLGAGEDPSKGAQAALESEQVIRDVLGKNTKMVFITAGMGGGTGTGAAPVIAQISKELNILTIGIVTVPFSFEGPKRFRQAQDGIDEMRQYVDSLIVINNDRLVEVYGDLGLKSAFAKADETLMVAAKGISEVITQKCLINIDLNDAKTVLKDSGTAIMGSARGQGSNRAKEVVQKALDSPLLNDNHIKGANKILLLIMSGNNEVTINETSQINQYLQRESGGKAEIIMGAGDDPSLGDDISVTVIATGVLGSNVNPVTGSEEKIVLPLHNEADNKSFQSHQFNQLDQSKNDSQLIQTDQRGENVVDLDELDDSEVLTSDLENETRDIVINDSENYSEENQLQAEQRRKRLLKFSNIHNNQKYIQELEDEPAYKRKGVELEKVEHSSYESSAKIVLDIEDDENKFKNNNSFLHDNVD